MPGKDTEEGTGNRRHNESDDWRLSGFELACGAIWRISKFVYGINNSLQSVDC